MSTRACYRFIDTDKNALMGGVVTVYKHHDGYPEGGVQAIQNALQFSWPLPRFEADEFASGFVAGNKPGAGGVRLVAAGGLEAFKEFASDIEFLYDITVRKDKLMIKIQHTSESGGEWSFTPEFEGTLAQAAEKYLKA